MTGPTRLGVVLAAWDPLEARATLDRVRSAFGPVCRITAVAVGNSPQALAAVEHRADIAVAGSNTDAEFSAYDEGLAVLRQHDVDPDVLLLVNDRAFAYRDVHLGPGTARLLGRVRRHGLAAGHLDALPAPMRVRDRRVHAYLRSNLLLLPGGALPADFRVTSVDADDLDELVPTEPPGEWRMPGLGELDYVAFLRDWLTGTRDAGSWYRARPVDEQSWPVLRAKVQSILNEHLLSARLEDDLALELVPLGAARRALVGSRPGRSMTRVLRPDRTQRWQRRTPRRAP